MAEVATRFILQLRKIGLRGMLNIKAAGETDSEFSFLILLSKPRFTWQIFEVEGLSNQLKGCFVRTTKDFALVEQ